MSEVKEAEFNGKVVLVTGGTKGMGAEIVRKFAKAGAKVVFSYSSSETQAKAIEAELSGLGQTATSFKANHAVAQECADFVKFAHDTYGNVDILVNSAGVYGAAAIGQDTEANFDKVMNVNVKGVWATTNAAVKVMNDSGRIINIGSIFSEKGFPDHGVYNASKFAVKGMTRAWARDLGSRKITVNCIQPGPINTEMNPDSPLNPGADFFKSITILKRYGQTDEVSAAVLFLASEKAAYITGASLNVDGGVLA
eukprot:TRINITY_DN2285_c0_g1_i1.p2 TRINITY_DN2285_c0_g1~~TRINITY_DN2285_c0_g1_i1.p2  ORF type:complete len:253 (-),score=84.14 TRINITY_DN2285_c0_g1_i1:6-764(-)